MVEGCCILCDVIRDSSVTWLESCTAWLQRHLEKRCVGQDWDTMQTPGWSGEGRGKTRTDLSGTWGKVLALDRLSLHHLLKIFHITILEGHRGLWAWRAAVHGVTMSRTWLRDWTTTRKCTPGPFWPALRVQEGDRRNTEEDSYKFGHLHTILWVSAFLIYTAG